jgi:nitric oxide reductase subunit B
MVSHKTRAVLLFVIVAAFSVLIFGGARIDEYKPPIPETVVDSAGKVVFTAADIQEGQRYYLARGGQHMGSIWGHGAMLAPDWSADALHRVALVTAGLKAGLPAEQARAFDQRDLQALPAGERGRVEALVAEELHANRYQPESKSLVLSAGQEAAIPALTAYYTELFSKGSDAMSIPAGTVDSPESGRKVTAFFFWTAWSAMTNRPGVDYTTRPTGPTTRWRATSRSPARSSGPSSAWSCSSSAPAWPSSGTSATRTPSPPGRSSSRRWPTPSPRPASGRPCRTS